MFETSKAMRRRFAEQDAKGFPWREIFVGDGLDVGSGDDPLTCARAFDLPDGGGDDIRDFFPTDQKFDFIHGSQVLEHAINAELMLQSWLFLLKPGGHIIATVPDWELYEKQTWPSKWNAGHRSSWSMGARTHGHWPHYILPGWLHPFHAEVILCRLIDTNYNYSLPPDIDQTLDAEKGVECFIEFVLRKP